MNTEQERFKALCEKEPLLRDLYRDVSSLSPHVSLRRGRWYAAEFKPRLSALVGIGARNEDLRNSDDYTFALNFLMGALPVVVAGIVSLNGRTVKVEECPFCGRTHTHGRGEGPRLSHCRKDSDRDTYIVAEVSPDEQR